MRFVPRAIGLAALLVFSFAQAQFVPPAPLAWRWWQQTSVLPKGTPLIGGDTIFLASGQRMYALNKDTGNQKWRFPATVSNAGNFHEMPVMADGVLVDYTDAGYAYGVDPETGLEKWKHFLPKMAVGPPAAAGKNVAIVLSDNEILALNAQSGEEVWKDGTFKVEDVLNGPLTGFGDSVLFFTGANDLDSLDIASKKIAWHTKFTFVESKTKPVVLGSTLYVNTGTYLAALNAATGRGLWQRDAGEQFVYEPGVGPSSIMVVTREGHIVSFDMTGARLSRAPIDIGSVPITGPGSVGDLFLIASGNGSINLIDPRTGASSWTFVIRPLNKMWARAMRAAAGASATRADGGRADVEYVTAAGPAVVDGKTLLVLARDGSLLAFDNELGVDLTGPKIKMVRPNPGEQLSGQPPLLIAFTIQDEASGVNEKSVKIELDGKPVEFEETKEHYYLLQVTEHGKLKPLADGRHTFTVTVSDWMGNRSKEEFSITIDNSLRPLRQAGVPGQPTGPTGGGGGGGGGGRGGGGG